MASIRHLDSIDQLGREGICRLLDRAAEIRRQPPDPACCRGKILGLLFFQPSTRTRFGFHAAIARLGGTGIELHEPRYEKGMTRPESAVDSVRSVSAYCDAVVLRHGDAEVFAAAMAASDVPVVNGGCGTERHPTQTLIDLFAIRERLGRLDGLRIGLAGDLGGSRSARSLVRGLRAFPPVELRLMAPSSSVLPDALLSKLTATDVRQIPRLEVGGLDALYMAGFPEGVGPSRADEEVRAPFRLTAAKARDLDDKAVVLSPLPRIDEIEKGVDAAPQAVYFGQSRLGLVVRMAVIEWAWSLV